MSQVVIRVNESLWAATFLITQLALEVKLWLSGISRLRGKPSLVFPLENQGKNTKHALLGLLPTINQERCNFENHFHKPRFPFKPLLDGTHLI